MAKGLGLAMGIDSSGLSMRVTVPTKAEDAVWDAVKEARSEGWTPKQFAIEAQSAWEQIAQDEADAEKAAARIALMGRQ